MILNNDPYCYLAAAILALAKRDAKSRSRNPDMIYNRRSAVSFIGNSPLARSIGELFDCDITMLHGRRQFGGFLMEYQYFIEMNDASGKRGRTDDMPVVIYGYVQPLRPGALNVIIVEEPTWFAEAWRAVPVDEWVALSDYRGDAGEVTEKKYAVLLSKVAGVPAQCRNAANRRALDSDGVKK
jgi:hypothetical protein